MISILLRCVCVVVPAANSRLRCPTTSSREGVYMDEDLSYTYACLGNLLQNFHALNFICTSILPFRPSSLGNWTVVAHSLLIFVLGFRRVCVCLGAWTIQARCIECNFFCGSMGLKGKGVRFPFRFGSCSSFSISLACRCCFDAH